MRGSLLITFQNPSNSNNITVYVNGALRNLDYNLVSDVYTTHLYSGDTVNIQVKTNLFQGDLNLIRRDYTTIDYGGDNGIRDTQISNVTGSTVSGVTSYTFVANPISSDYNFEYRINIYECYNNNGSLFYLANGTSVTSPTTTAIDSLGRIYAVGVFRYYGTSPANYIIRFLPNGQVDTSFNVGTSFNNSVLNILVREDNRIIVVGQFTSYNGTAASNIIGLNEDGSIDTTFNYGTGFNTSAGYFIQKTNDNKIIVTGTFSSYRGNPSGRIVRINFDGSYDSTFAVPSPGFSASSGIPVFDIQQDNKIIVVGVTSYGGTTVKGLVRLNTNGSIDNSFNVGTGPLQLSGGQNIQIQSDGKVIYIGNFTQFNGVSQNKIIRLNTNGSIDSSYNVGTGLNFPLTSSNSTFLQSDNKLIINTDSPGYNGSYLTNNVFRINTDGSLDNTFNTLQVDNLNSSASTSRGPVIFGNNMYFLGNFNLVNGITINAKVKTDLNGNFDSCRYFSDNISYLFFASTTSTGATNDWVDSRNTLLEKIGFRYNTGQVSFSEYIQSRIINGNDRLVIYNHNVCQDKDLITYVLNFPQKSGQTSTQIGAFFAHPAWMGTITEIGDPVSTPFPSGGITSNSRGTFYYNGIQYRLYQFLTSQTPGTVYNRKVKMCS